MQSCRRLFLTLGVGVLASFLMAAGPPKKKPIIFNAQPGAEIRAGLKLTGASGWILIDLDTGEVLDAMNADRPFVPASVAKLPTAAYVLDAMGSDFRFETRLRATGEVADGALNGDLILEGGGDPELDTDALAALAKQLAARGVRNVTGAFLADGSALPQLVEIDPGQAAESSYNPSLSGLNLNFNRVHVKWDARNGRRELTVEAEATNLSPSVDRIQVLIAKRRGQPVFSLREQGEREIWQMSREAFRGQAARWLPVKRPEPYAGEVFRTVARDSGLTLPAATTGPVPDGAAILATHQSRPLGEVLRAMLRYSTNITAEATGTWATRHLGVEAGSLAESAAVMNAWAASVAGFDVGDPGFNLANHSGLSLEGRVSPRRMVELLAALGRRAADPGAGHRRLPGGIAGYLKNHNVAIDDVPLDYDNLSVVAKTGTMNFIRGLAGYIATPRGRRLAFAIFSNDLARRGRGAQRVNRRWMGRARGFERALIRAWVIRVDGLG